MHRQSNDRFSEQKSVVGEGADHSTRERVRSPCISL